MRRSARCSPARSIAWRPRAWNTTKFRISPEPGQRCRHNEVYWSGGSYFAAGPGASRYLEGVRETNHRSTTTYLKRVLSGGSPVADRERLEPEDRVRELLVFGLRRMEGVARDWFTARTGFKIDALVGQPLEQYLALGLFEDVGERIRADARRTVRQRCDLAGFFAMLSNEPRTSVSAFFRNRATTAY